MISKKQYPAKDGWIIADLTMKSSAVVEADKVKAMLSCGEVESYEFSDIEQHGKRVRAAFRKKSEVAA